MDQTPALSHPRWSAAMLFWSATLLVVFLLFAPPNAESQSRALFTLGAGVLAAAWWFTDGRARQPETFVLGPAILALAVVQALATLWSQDAAISLNPLAHELAHLLFFLTAMAAARSPRGVRQALAWLVVPAAALALYGVYQTLGGLDESARLFFAGRIPQGPLEQQIALRLNARRAFALFAYPNLLAGFLGMLLPVAVSLAALAQSHARRLAWSLAAAAMLTGLAATGSVGGWLCAGAGLGLLLWLAGFAPPAATPARRTRWLLFAAGLVLLAITGWFIIQQRGLGSVLGDAQDRLANWQSAGQMALAFPLTGVGPGFFGTLFPEFQSAQGYYVRFAHNFLLHQAAETGLAGLLAWLGFLGVALWALAVGFRRLEPGRKRLLASGLAGGAAAGFLHACLDVDFHFLKTTMVFWLLLGTLFGLLRRPGAPGRHDSEAGARQPVAEYGNLVRAGLLAMLALVLWRGGRSPAIAGLLYGLCGVLVVLFLLAQTRTFSSWREWFQRLPLRWPLGLLFVWGIFSAMVSSNPSAAIPGMMWAAVGLILYVLLLRTPGMGTGLLLLAAAGSAAMALLGMPRVLDPAQERLAAGWPNANLAAAFFSMGVLALTAIAGFLARRPWQRAAAAGGACLSFAALLATGSFGGMLNLAAGFAVLLLWTWRYARGRLAWLVPAVLLLALLAAVLPLNLRQRWQQLPSYQGQVYERAHIAWSALGMARDRPLAGWGPGNFAAAFEAYSFPNVRGLARYGKWAEFAHNEPLQVLAVMGVPGLLLLLWVAWGVLLAARRQWTILKTRTWPPDEAAARLAAWACLAGAAAQGMVDFNWHLPALWLWGMAWLGLALSPLQLQLRMREKLPAPAVWFSRLDALSLRLPAVVLLLLAATAVVAACRPWYSEYLQGLGAAQQSEKNLKSAAREYQRALVVHPLAPAAYDRLGQIQTEFYAAMGTDHWFQLAEWAFTKALQLNRMDAFIYRHLGKLYALKAERLQGWERQQQLDRAIWQYRLALERAPHQAFLQFELGNLQREAGYLQAAEQNWQAAVDLEPCYAAAWSNLGVARELRGDAAAAEAGYRRALGLRRLAAEARGTYEQELTSLNWTVVHFNLARLLETQQRWSEARAEYAQILQLEPDNPEARKRLDILKND